jgi:hypothetical protein
MQKIKVIVKDDTVTAGNVEIQSPYIAINGKETISNYTTLYELVGFGLYCAQNKAGEVRIDGMFTSLQNSSDAECVYGTKVIMQRGLGSITSCVGLFVENAELEYE